MTSSPRGLPFLALALLLCSCSAPRNLGPARPQSLADVDASLLALRPILAFYPPAIDSDGEREQVRQHWTATEAALTRLAAADPQNPGLQWRLGLLYRYGNNLDVPGAGGKCVEHLQRAIDLRPDYADAYLELGIFYTDAGPRYAPLGESNLRKAIQLASPKPLPRGWKALVFNYYYQGKFSESVAAADQYLALNPNSEGIRKIKAAAEKAAAQGGMPPEPGGWD